MTGKRKIELAVDRRTLIRGAASASIAMIGATYLPRTVSAQDASPSAAGWSFTDVTGQTVSLPQRPTRISAYINNAASLWDFGIRPETVFGWTASNEPEGDHIAWGDIEPSAVGIISDIDGNVDLEKLAEADPELIVTWTWNKEDVENATNGFPAEVLDRARQIAPILVLNQGDPDDEEMVRNEALAETLGADLQDPRLVEERANWNAKADEVRAVASEKADLTVMFASFGAQGVYYVAGPDYVANLGYLRKLGVSLVNDGSAGATQYWEEISTEDVLHYPCDVIYLDAYGEYTTLEALQEQPTLRLHPAIAAGQVGIWNRDFPQSYSGLDVFLEEILTPLRIATKVS